MSTHLAELGKARADALRALEAATKRLRAATLHAIDVDGMSESEAARQAGVTRMTIRAWLGKNQPRSTRA